MTPTLDGTALPLKAHDYNLEVPSGLVPDVQEADVAKRIYYKFSLAG